MGRKSKTRRGLALFLSLMMIAVTLLGNLTAFAASPSAVNAETDGETGNDEFDAMRQKFYDMAVGGEYDPNDEAVKPMLHSINETAKLYWEKMNKAPVSNAIGGSYRDSGDNLIEGLDSSKDYIFEEYPLGRRRPSSTVYINANSIHFTFQYIRAMALAYETKGCELYQNKEMLADIKAAIKFVYDNHFNPGISRYGNWFSWQIGAPIYLGETLMLLYDEFTPEEIEAYAAAMIHFLGKTTMTGANATWTERVRMYAGILLKDSSWLDFVKSRMPGMLTYTTSGDGYYKDGTFVQHNTITYNGGYGLMCLTDSAYIIYMLSGSPWALSGDSANIVYQWVFDTYEPFVYNGLAMDAFRGREITRYDTTQPRGSFIIANAMLMLAEDAPADVAAQFKGVIKQWFGTDFMIDELNNSADTPWFKFPMDTVVKVNEIMKDESIAPISLSGSNYQMNAGARTIHWADDWAYTISMTSKRISNCEIGDSNAKGWYTGCGMTWLYNADQTRFEGVNKATIDWYRLPGATAVYGKPLNSQNRNLNSFTGGVTDGTYGVTGMDFAVAKNNQEMKKSWFLFDDEVVALGSGIKGTGDLETTLENYMIDEENRTYSVDGKGQTMTMDGEVTTYPAASTFHMQGNVEHSDIGFYFPNGADLNVKSENRTGKWSDLGEYNTDTSPVSADYFTVWQSHGTNPTDGSYSYVLLPGMSEAQTADYASSGEVEILRQDETAHAVYEKSLGILGVNFWQNGANSLDACGVQNFINTDSAASIMVSENDKGMEVSVADSTQENKGYINVEINRAAKGVVAMDDGVELIQSSPSIKFRVNVKGSAGKTFQVKFSYDEVELQPTEILSAEMQDDALAVTLKTTPNATGYEVKYGTESGNYTESIETKAAGLSIYGLVPGQTYYLAAVAKNAEGISAVSGEVTVTVPASTTFFDDFENFDKMLSYSSGWLFDPASPSKYEGDGTRLKRAAKTEEYISYLIPGLEDFSLEVWGYRRSIGDIGIYTSEDGETWTAQAYQMLGTVPADGEWFKEVLTPDGAVNAGANYIKVVLKSHPEKIWAPQFTKFRATMRNSSDEKNLQDPLLNDGRMYECENLDFIQNTDGALYGGDSDVVLAKDGAEGRMLYSYTNIQKAKITAYVSGEGSVSVSTSKDGETMTFAELTKTEEPVSETVKKVVYEVSGLADETDFMEIKVKGAIALSKVSLDYKPDNSPIRKIHFADRSLDGVIAYDAEPMIKKAPANGISEISYTTSDGDVARYVNGVLEFVGTGEAVATASVVDGASSTELPLNVYKNMCLKKPVTVSSTTGSYPSSWAVDGDMVVSRWQSGQGASEWIQVDMGAGASFDAVDIEWYSNGPDYNILISDDGETWTTLKEVRGAQTGGYVRFDFDETKTGRYLKVEGAGDAIYSLFEVRALSKASAGEGPQEIVNLALGKTATVSANDPNDGNLKAPKAIDGDESTRWASGRDDNQWYIVDLESTCEIHAINILWEGAAGKEYKVQISDDKENWTDMVHETGNSGAGWKRYNLSRTYRGRYVRMFGISRVNTKYGYSMYEFEVMGVDLSATTVLPFTEITLDKNEIALLKGQSAQLKPETKPISNAISVGWKSSNPEIVSVDSRGNIKVLGEAGSAVITAYSVLDENVKAECTVKVTPYAGEVVRVESVKITGAPEGVVYTGDSHEMGVSVLPENATNKNVRWETSDPSVVIVDAGGRLTGVAPGKAAVTVTSVASSLTDRVEITVENAPLYEIAVAKEKPEAMADPVAAVLPEGPVREGTAVTVKISGIPEGYLFNGIAVYSSEGKEVEVKEVTENVPAGERQFVFTMPGAGVKTVAKFTADKGALEALINEAGEKVKEDYTSESWKTLEAILTMARSAVSDAGAGKDEVAQVAEGLKDALAGLTFVKSGDLKNFLEKTEDLDYTKYSEENRKKIEAAVKAAEEAVAAEQAGTLTKDQVEQVWALAKEAEKLLGTNPVEVVIEKPEAMETPSVVTVPTESAGAGAVVTVKASGISEGYRLIAMMASDADGNAVDVKEVTTGVPEGESWFTFAMAHGKVTVTAVFGADMSALTALIMESEGKAEEDYKHETFEAFLAARNEAMIVAGNPEASKEEVEAAAAGLRAAMDGLKSWKFTDVAEDDWFYDAVHEMYNRGIMTGYNPEENTFQPYGILARAQFAVTLSRLNGEAEVSYAPIFPDVPEGIWYTNAVLWANGAGVITGYGEAAGDRAGFFGPADNIQRQQMAVMMYRYADYMKYDVSEKASLADYTDAALVDTYAEEAMEWAVGAGIISGKDGQTRLDPAGNTSRAECAVILQRFIKKYVTD